MARHRKQGGTGKTSTKGKTRTHKKQQWAKNEVGKEVIKAADEGREAKKLDKLFNDDVENLFTVDTAGSKKGLPKTLKRSLIKEAQVKKGVIKGPKKYSETEMLKVAKFEKAFKTNEQKKADGKTVIKFDTQGRVLGSKSSANL